jgi:uncharacterized protein YjbI with pentapeptide repeats
MKIFAVVVLLAAIPPAGAACTDPPGPGVDWSRCTKTRLVLKGQALKDVRLEKAVLVGVDFGSSDLRNGNFAGSEMNHSSFKNARLDGARFEKAFAVRVDFAGAQFIQATLEKAELHRSVFSGAVLRGVNLAKGDFGRSNFEKADLRDASLRLSNLGHASFVGANLAGADLTRAFTFRTRFVATDLSRVKGLTQVQLDEACGDAKTGLPPGLKTPASWPCQED